jgi:hypothetical protein
MPAVVTSHSLFFTELCVSATFCVSFHAGSSLLMTDFGLSHVNVFAETKNLASNVF